MRLFYVDPTGRRTDGDQITLTRHEILTPEGATHDGFQTIKERFSGGLSPHGARYVYADLAETRAPATVMREWLFEITRRSTYADYIPSRFQSVLAYDTKRGAVQQATQSLSPGTYPLCALVVDDPAGPFYTGHLQGETVPDMMYHAEAYWDGLPHAKGQREYLLSPPVTVETIVEQVDIPEST